MENESTIWDIVKLFAKVKAKTPVLKDYLGIISEVKSEKPQTSICFQCNLIRVETTETWKSYVIILVFVVVINTYSKREQHSLA